MPLPQSSAARANSPKLPGENWLEALAFGDRDDLDVCQLVSTQFAAIVAQNSCRLAVRLTCRLELGWSVVTLHASEGHVQAGPLLSIELDNNQAKDYLDALRVVNTEYGKHYFKDVFICFGALADEVINSLREKLPGIIGAHSLTIYNHTRRYGDPLRSERLSRLLGAFDKLIRFDAICLPERFDWYILSDERLRSIPQFRACSVEDVPLSVPDGEALMEYLFDFSHVGDTEARSVHLEDCPVTDEFLVALVQGFVGLDRKLTVEVGQDPSGEPLRFDGVTEQLLGKALHSAYYYEFPGSNVRAFSRSFRFLITNCPETAEKLREEYSKYGHNRLRAGD